MILCIGDLRSRVGRCAARTSSRTVCSVIYAWRRGFRRTTRCARSESSSTKACWSCRRLSASFMRERAGRRSRRTSALTKTNPPALTFTDPPSAQVNGVGHGRLFPAQACSFAPGSGLDPDRPTACEDGGPHGAYRKGSARSDHHASAATKLWPAHRCMNAAWAWSVDGLEEQRRRARGTKHSRVSASGH